MMLGRSAFLILLLILFQLSSGDVADNNGDHHTTEKVGLLFRVNARKSLREIMLDYDYASANWKHDPRNG